MDKAKTIVAIQTAEIELVESDLYKRVQKLKAQLKQEEAHIEWIKENTKQYMIEKEMKSVDISGQKLTLKKTSWKLKVLDEELIPSVYKKTKEVVTIDKKAIKEAMNLWDNINWVDLEQWYTLSITAK